MIAVGATVFALGLVACGGGEGASPARSPSPNPSAPAQSLPPVASAADFDPANFSHPTEVTNPWFPLVPGTRFT
jgi:hypothetical protein